MQLKSPAELRTTGLQQDQDAGENQKGKHNTGGKYEAVVEDTAPVLPALLHKSEYFKGQNRQDAGHQIENEPARKGKQNRPEETQFARICDMLYGCFEIQGPF